MNGDATTTNGSGAPAETLYDRAISRMLATPERVRTAAEGKALLASNRRAAATAEGVQKVAVLAVPVMRTLARGSRLSRVPWALVASTTVSVALTLRAGIRELQVLGSLVAHRVEAATGQPADPDLVKKLTVELYLAPGSPPDLSDRRVRLGRVAAGWLLRGALGRETGKAAVKALEAADRLDVHVLLARWAEHAARRPTVAPGTGASR
jgi:hypothetical protein